MRRSPPAAAGGVGVGASSAADNEDQHQDLLLPRPTEAAMGRIWFRMHHRVCKFWLRYTSSVTRRLLEHALLLSAILCFGILIIMHKNFVFRSDRTNCASSCLSGYRSREADLVHLSVDPELDRTVSIVTEGGLGVVVLRDGDDDDDGLGCHPPDDVDCASKEKMMKDGPPPSSKDRNVEYSYSKRRGYLQLDRDDDDDALFGSITVQHIIVSPNDLRCFGDGALQFLVWKLGIGWDTILLNWLLAFNEPDEVAYVHHVRTQRSLEMVVPSPRAPGLRCFAHATMTKLGVLIRTSFLFFFCTTLVSFTLNETQERMLEFTQELSRRVARNLPINFLVTTHVLDSLIFCPLMVGKFFFLIEFYKGDRFLAFLFMSVVWFVEVFTVLSLRSFHGITYFPRIFFLLFCLFHIYYFANPSIGFSYLAFWVIVLFIVHSMMFFWHRYELPAVAFGYINVRRPRANPVLQQQQPPPDPPATPPSVRRVFRGGAAAHPSSSSSRDAPVPAPEDRSTRRRRRRDSPFG